MPSPDAPHTDYITPEGYARLKSELDFLWRVERPKITHEVSEAAALGDRSENGGYIYGKKRLREIDRRMRYLTKRIEGVTVVSEPPERKDRVFFGAWVTLEDEDGGTVTYRLVGTDETDAKSGTISIESPVGRALMGRREDDEVTVHRPAGAKTFTIVEIRYTPPT